jgi:hypothetical protein
MAGFQTAVEWQASQVFVVFKCVDVLPIAGRWAAALSWQEKQVADVSL